MTVMMIMSIILLTLSHPLSMSTALIGQTILIALMTGYISNMFILSYMLTIMMVSGTLVLFMYMSSIASNETFKPSIKLTLTVMFMILWLSEEEMEFMLKNKPYNKVNEYEQSMTLNYMYSKSEMMMSMTLVLYLFITLIVINYIISIQEGPMRPKN